MAKHYKTIVTASTQERGSMTVAFEQDKTEDRTIFTQEIKEIKILNDDLHKQLNTAKIEMNEQMKSIRYLNDLLLFRIE